MGIPLLGGTQNERELLGRGKEGNDCGIDSQPCLLRYGPVTKGFHVLQCDALLNQHHSSLKPALGSRGNWPNIISSLFCYKPSNLPWVMK